jgi:hypothetical protein
MYLMKQVAYTMSDISERCLLWLAGTSARGSVITIIARIPHAIPVTICLIRVADCGAVIVYIQDTVIVRIKLENIGRTGI